MHPFWEEMDELKYNNMIALFTLLNNKVKKKINIVIYDAVCRAHIVTREIFLL